MITWVNNVKRRSRIFLRRDGLLPSYFCGIMFLVLMFLMVYNIALVVKSYVKKWVGVATSPVYRSLVLRWASHDLRTFISYEKKYCVQGIRTLVQSNKANGFWNYEYSTVNQSQMVLELLYSQPMGPRTILQPPESWSSGILVQSTRVKGCWNHSKINQSQGTLDL